MRAVAKKTWRRWIKVAEFLGNVQMGVFLFLVYFLMVPVIAVPFKLLSDPLALRRSRRWVKRDSSPASLDTMRNQF